MPSIPYVIDRKNGAERSYDIYSRLLEDRIVMVTGPIEAEMASSVIAQLLYLDNQDAEKDITMYIDSPGGEVYAGLGIIDTMRLVKAPVATVAVGFAASMASLILASGTKGKRAALSHATVLIHQPSSTTEGKATDMEIDLRETLRVKTLTNEILVQTTGKSLEEVTRDTDRDHYLSAEDAKAYGIVDEIIQTRND